MTYRSDPSSKSRIYLNHKPDAEASSLVQWCNSCHPSRAKYSLGIRLRSFKSIVRCNLHGWDWEPADSQLYTDYPQNWISLNQRSLSESKCSVRHPDNIPGKINVISPYLSHNSKGLPRSGSGLVTPKISSSPFLDDIFFTVPELLLESSEASLELASQLQFISCDHLERSEVWLEALKLCIPVPTQRLSFGPGAIRSWQPLHIHLSLMAFPDDFMDRLTRFLKKNNRKK